MRGFRQMPLAGELQPEAKPGKDDNIAVKGQFDGVVRIAEIFGKRVHRRDHKDRDGEERRRFYNMIAGCRAGKMLHTRIIKEKRPGIPGLCLIFRLVHEFVLANPRHHGAQALAHLLDIMVGLTAARGLE